MSFLLLLLTPIAALVGGLIGWFGKGNKPSILSYCLVAVTIVYISLAVAFGSLPNSFTLDYLLTGAVYHIIPFVCLMLLPAILSCLCFRFVRAKMKKAPPQN